METVLSGALILVRSSELFYMNHEGEHKPNRNGQLAQQHKVHQPLKDPVCVAGQVAGCL